MMEIGNQMQHIYSSEEIKKISKSLPIDQDKWEVRFCVGVITAFFIGDLMRCALYIFTKSPIPLTTVAELSRVPFVVACMFLTAAILAIPHLWTLIFHPKNLHRMRARQLATYGGAIATLTWIFVAGTAFPLDIGLAALSYWGKAFGCLIVSYAYAHSINSQQNREAIENDKQAIG
jgi:hypothetical protein